MASIYMVEDDDNIREMVVYALMNNGFDVVGFDRASTFMVALKKHSCDLVILDLMLPEESGLDVLRRLKQGEYKDVPVIILSAKSLEFDRIKGLDAGADDYIVKPFGILELISRIKAVLRRTQGSTDEDEVLVFQSIALHKNRRLVLVGEEQCQLTYKEFELLYFFMKNVNVVLSRERIMDVVWGFDFEGESRTVDMHVMSLRQKLKMESAWIQTIRSVGYRLGD